MRPTFKGLSEVAATNDGENVASTKDRETDSAIALRDIVTIGVNVSIAQAGRP
ncbi:MAG TPA: hypothetical protein VKN18_15015 [Blastocatellia bacterium]|nr:hypothetical protein [Blastocatellia bacterium]